MDGISPSNRILVKRPFRLIFFGKSDSNAKVRRNRWGGGGGGNTKDIRMGQPRSRWKPLVEKVFMHQVNIPQPSLIFFGTNYLPRFHPPYGPSQQVYNRKAKWSVTLPPQAAARLGSVPRPADVLGAYGLEAPARDPNAHACGGAVHPYGDQSLITGSGCHYITGSTPGRVVYVEGPPPQIYPGACPQDLCVGVERGAGAAPVCQGRYPDAGRAAAREGGGRRVPSPRHWQGHAAGDSSSVPIAAA